MLKCGFYEVDITPALGGDMPGYFTERRTTTIRDTLFAKAFAVQAQGDPVVIIVLDALMVDKVDADRIREGIAAAIGTTAANVAVGATHIHTGGAVISLYDSKRDEDYCHQLVQRAVNAGVMAFQRMEDAKLGVAARDVEGIAFNRRFLMKDGSYKTNPGIQNPEIEKSVEVIDPELVMIRVDKADGTPMGIIANYALHTDTVNEKGYGYSADYPGQLRKKIRKEFGEDMAFMFIQGTSGNVNHHNVWVGKDEQKCYKEIAEVLFDAFMDMYPTIETADVEKVVCTSCMRTGYTRRPTKAECDALKSNPTLLKEMLPVMDLPSEKEEFEIWSAMIGETAINMLPGELFARFGLEAKAQGGCKYTMNGELSNVSIGYVYTKEAEVQGGYEATPSTYVRMNSDTGYTIVEGAVANMKKLQEM